MNIIIDSTEFKRDRGLNKVDVSLIRDMGNKNLLKLHIPYFVYKECTSSSVSDLGKELKNIKNTLLSFNRKGMGVTDFLNSKNIASQIDDMVKNSSVSNKELWGDFIHESKAILYEFDEKDSINVVDSYFSGGKPFKSLKSRNDFPDAFIYETIKKLSEMDVLYLISGDKNLREKSVELGNVEAFENFKEFYKNANFNAIQIKYKLIKETEKVEKAKQIILDSRDEFEDAVKNYTRQVNYLEVSDTDFPSDNGDVTINEIYNTELTIFDNEIKFIDNRFFIPIEVKGTASIDYSIFKADYWANEYSKSIIEDLNKHYFLIEDSAIIVLEKTIIIELDDIKEDEFLEISIDEFDGILLEED